MSEINCDFVKEKIEKHLKGSIVEAESPRGDNVHFSVVVKWSGFKDLNRVEQHRVVFEAFEDVGLESCGMPLHALQIKCKLK